MDSHDDRPVLEQGAADISSAAAQEPQAGSPEAGPGPRPAPTTGDPAVDGVIEELSAVRGLPLGAHIEAGEKAHRILQARLSDLGGE